MDPLLLILSMVISLAISYFIIKAAVTGGMKEHTRWQVENRDEIEATYAKHKPTPSGPTEASVE